MGVYVYKPPKIEANDYANGILEGKGRTNEKSSLIQMIKQI